MGGQRAEGEKDGGERGGVKHKGQGRARRAQPGAKQRHTRGRDGVREGKGKVGEAGGSESKRNHGVGEGEN